MEKRTERQIGGKTEKRGVYKRNTNQDKEGQRCCGIEGHIGDKNRQRDEVI